MLNGLLDVVFDFREVELVSGLVMGASEVCQLLAAVLGVLEQSSGVLAADCFVVL